MASKSSCPDAAAFRSMLDGKMAEDAMAELAAHLETCQRCRETFELLANSSEGLPCSTTALGNQADTTPETLLRRVANVARTTAENKVVRKTLDPQWSIANWK